MTPPTVNLETGIAACIRLITAPALKHTVVLAGIAGGSCSGKSYISQRIAAAVKGTCLAMDDYYIGRKRMADDNFDNPAAIEFPLLKSHLASLKQGHTITKPVYNFACSERVGEEKYSAGNIILVEGLFALEESLVSLYGLKIYIEADEKVRFFRRLERDTTIRHIPGPQVLSQWQEGVCPSHYRWVEPQRTLADLVIQNS